MLISLAYQKRTYAGDIRRMDHSKNAKKKGYTQVHNNIKPIYTRPLPIMTWTHSLMNTK